MNSSTGNNHFLKKYVRNEKILILGLTFKGFPKTSDTKDSTTILLIDYLNKQGIKNIILKSIHTNLFIKFF